MGRGSPPRTSGAPGRGGAPGRAGAARPPGEAPAPAFPAVAPVSLAAAELAGTGAALVGDAPERAVVLLALALRADRTAAEAVLAALDAVQPDPAHAAAFAFVRGEALRAAGRHDESRIAYASAESLALAPAEAGAPRSSQ